MCNYEALRYYSEVQCSKHPTTVRMCSTFFNNYIPSSSLTPIKALAAKRYKMK